MKAIPLALLALALICVARAAHSEEPDLTKLRCPVSVAAQGKAIYVHKHEVPIVGADTPTDIVTDELTIVGRDKNVLCFGLTTYARNFHLCGFMGIAQSKSDGSFLFQEGNGVIRLTILSNSKIRVAPIGDGYRSRCGMYGVIEDATYERALQANPSLERTHDR